jgi:hypothetical protein
VTGDQLFKLPVADADDIGGSGAAEQLDQPVGDHLLFLGVPILALAVNVNPDAKTLLVRQRTVGHLDRYLPELLPSLRDQRARIYPAPPPSMIRNFACASGCGSTSSGSNRPSLASI